MPPPMKLSKEMIEGFGGVNSEHYQQFRRECYTAFLYLRRHANLILNLFGLMVDASVPDIALEPDKTVKKVQVGTDIDPLQVYCINTVPVHTVFFSEIN
jgi:phosphatidylinositol 3-kinase